MSEKIPSLFQEKRNRWHGKYILPLAFTLSAGAHIGMMFPEKIADAIENAPRKLRAMKNTYGAEKHAQEFVQRYADKLERHQPLDLDLKNFYLAAEMAAGGLTKEEAQEASKIFEDLIAETKELQKTTSRTSVIDHLLEQQGEYTESHSYLSDLLRKKKGNCEAREKFLSAAFQAIYPDEVKEGKLKMEVFGAFKDEAGTNHPGHVRAIVNEADGVTVLEGGVAKKESKESHADIPSYEVTQMAVKSVAAAQGQYDLNADKFIAQEKQKGTSKTEKSSGFSFGSDSIAKYPASKQSYKDTGRGLSSITQDFLKNEHGAIKMEIHKGKLSDLMKNPNEITEKNVQNLVTDSTNGIGIVLDYGTHLTDGAWNELQTIVTKRKKSRGSTTDVTLSHVRYPNTPAKDWKRTEFLTKNEFNSMVILIDDKTTSIDLGPIHAKEVLLVYEAPNGNVNLMLRSDMRVDTFILQGPKSEPVFIKPPFQNPSLLSKSTLRLVFISMNDHLLDADIGCLDLRYAGLFQIDMYEGRIGTILLSTENQESQNIAHINGPVENIISVIPINLTSDIPENKKFAGDKQAFSTTISEIVLDRLLEEHTKIAKFKKDDWRAIRSASEQQWKYETGVSKRSGVDRDGNGIPDELDQLREK